MGNVISSEQRMQGRDEIVIHASPETIFSILQDSTLLSQWMPVVNATTGKLEEIDAVRHCDVSFSGKKGQVAEKCIECVPNRRIAWLLIDDTLGFGKMLEDFNFSFDLVEKGEKETLVVNKSFFKPKTILARVMVWLMIRRKFRQVRMMALTNLKKISEELARIKGQGV
ncbi:MAG: SRPBCC family protein [Candidatus Omnitrophica bacterium]|nr:SRPBCC family protein [Candidatus Omnitrophota bacterium]